MLYGRGRKINATRKVYREILLIAPFALGLGENRTVAIALDPLDEIYRLVYHFRALYLGETRLLQFVRKKTFFSPYHVNPFTYICFLRMYFVSTFLYRRDINIYIYIYIRW